MYVCAQMNIFRIQGTCLADWHHPLSILFSVCIYVNPTCSCGSHLDRRKITLLPPQFGPGSINRVLREAVQAGVDCARHEHTVFSLLQEGQGKVIITGESLSGVRDANLYSFSCIDRVCSVPFPPKLSGHFCIIALNPKKCGPRANTIF